MTPISLDRDNLPDSCIFGTYLSQVPRIFSEGLYIPDEYIRFTAADPGSIRPVTVVPDDAEATVWIDIHAALSADYPFYWTTEGFILSPGILGAIPARFILRITERLSGLVIPCVLDSTLSWLASSQTLGTASVALPSQPVSGGSGGTWIHSTTPADGSSTARAVASLCNLIPSTPSSSPLLPADISHFCSTPHVIALPDGPTSFRHCLDPDLKVDVACTASPSLCNSSVEPMQGQLDASLALCSPGHARQGLCAA